MIDITDFDSYQAVYKYSIEQPEAFWAEVAGQYNWQKKWDKVLDWEFETPQVRWFEGGIVNITENCLDRHLDTKGEQAAIIWEPNEPDQPSRTLTYTQLHKQVCQFANALSACGVVAGDRVCIYMPMIPELVIAVLACARIGAVHSVVFAGFSASALADRLNDSQARLLIGCDGGYRGSKYTDIKTIIDQALESSPGVEICVVCRHSQKPIHIQAERDIWWHDFIESATGPHSSATAMKSEDPLFVLYTSGSTGKPKGVVHSMGGFMVYAGYTFKQVFQYKQGDIFWCTADIGWITGHTYLIYGPLLNGATVLMYEGVPSYPDAGRFWNIIDKHKVNIFYTAPTAIRSLEAFGNKWPANADLSSLRILGSVGEPINEEAWHWYYDQVGKGRCPITDTWWQTETGGIMIAPIAGITPTKPGYATLPLPGIVPVLIDNEGKILEGNDVEGNLCIGFPWPGIIQTTYKDHERCRQTYFSTYPGLYFTGDGARRDHDGYYRILGRVDDIINVSGHRIGTAEVENAINEAEAIIESAVVGYAHALKGQGIYAFVILDSGFEGTREPASVRAQIMASVTRIIGPIAKPDQIIIVDALPKTRSGKIMRRVLRKIVEKDIGSIGDTSTLTDPSVVDRLVAAVGLQQE